MKTKIAGVIVLALIVAGIIAGISRQKQTTVLAPITTAALVEQKTIKPLVNKEVLASAIETPFETVALSKLETKSKVENVSPVTALSTPAPAPRPAKEPIRDPMAREALAFVGTDAEAEAYWYDAINDPSLSANERQDLIEDLNEDGLSDPKHPRPEDLPTILNRLALIEEVAPEAMDQVNAKAFQEAYKDLVNLAKVATGSGDTVD